MTDITDSTTYQIVRKVLDEWQHTQINLASDSARHLLTLAIQEQMDKHTNQLIEDVVCPERVVDY